MDSFGARFFYETDVLKVTYWSQAFYQYYYTVKHSEWGFPILASIVLLMLFWMVLKTLPTLSLGIGNLWRRTPMYRLLQGILGRFFMGKLQRAREDVWISDKFTDVVEEGVEKGNITRKRAQEIYRTVGKALSIPDLVPAIPRKRVQAMLKATLKNKHNSNGNVVTMRIDRKVKKHKPTPAKSSSSLLSRLNLARKAG